MYSDFVEYKELDRAPLTSIHPGILVAFDSTALASLYNYPTHISDEILRAYSQLRGHAFLPHQALKEFWAALDGASPVPAAAERVRSALASFKETLPEERNSPW
ncbi:MAG: PIN-like domain-containing protein, partial [Rothia mucilaginosa]